MRTRHLIPALLLLGSAALQARDYHIDQTAYFPTPAAEATDLKALQADIDALTAPAPMTATTLLAYLRRVETLMARGQRHNAYLHLRSALDADDQVAADGYHAAGTALGALTIKLRTTLRSVGNEGFASLAATEPALRKYAYALDKATRSLPHELPASEQAIVDDMYDEGTNALWNVYQKTRRATVYGKVHTPQGDLDVNKDATALAANPDRDVRREAWQRKQADGSAQAQTYASILTGVVRINDRSARFQHFSDAAESLYFGRQFDRTDVHATTAALQAQADVLKDYQRVRAAEVGRRLGITEVHSWDMAVPLPGFRPPVFDYEAMRQTIPKALAPLGKDYVAHFTALLDPATQRTDLTAALGNRELDNFSIAAPGVPAGLFLESWSPTLKSTSIVAHEGGHAIHSQLMNEHGVSPLYNHGPNWMHEGIAILNEMLLYEYLYRHAPDAATRAYYLQAQLDEMTFEIFTSAQEAQLEEGIYEGVMAGRLRNAADLDALTLDVTSRFGIWPAIDPELAHAWIDKRLMYQDPFYLVNYMYAGLWAAKMFDMAMTDPADFQQRYGALMAEGFDAPPKEVLRRFFGRDLPPDELVGADMALIRRKTADLRQLYEAVK